MKIIKGNGVIWKIKKKSPQVQELSTMRGLYEKCTRTVDNIDFLILRFLHISEKFEKERLMK